MKINGTTKAASTVEVEMVVPLKYLSNFWRTLELPLIYREISLMLNWSQNCLISNRSITFAITDTKLYILVVTLSSNDNTKLLQQLNSGFKRRINQNKYQFKVTNPGTKSVFGLFH